MSKEQEINCCHKCREKHSFDLGGFRGMIVCPVCGNKRCPKASDHELICTGSNLPGQEGSIYK